MRALNAFAISGAAEVRMAQLTTDRFDVAVSGSAKIALDTLTATALTASTTGTSTVPLAGAVQSQSIEIDGTGTCQAPQLTSLTAEVSIAGSGRVVLRVLAELNVSIDGSGVVEYYGRPTITRKIAGTGTVRHLDG